jgi:hypothetical protein
MRNIAKIIIIIIIIIIIETQDRGFESQWGHWIIFQFI